MPCTVNDDLCLGAAYSLNAGIFYVDYLPLEVPNNFLSCLNWAVSLDYSHCDQLELVP
ncbi:hypothetical protein DSUL_20572 [Desulfovibrionales bacterium]